MVEEIQAFFLPFEGSGSLAIAVHTPATSRSNFGPIVLTLRER